MVSQCLCGAFSPYSDESSIPCASYSPANHIKLRKAGGFYIINMKMINNTHQQLVNKFNWYNKWHRWNYHHHVHIGILSIYLMAVISIGYKTIINSSKAVRASSNQIVVTSQAEWEAGNLVVIDSTSTPGSIKMAIPTVEGYYADDTPLTGIGGSHNYPNLVDENDLTGVQFLNEITQDNIYYLIDFKVSQNINKVNAYARWTGGAEIVVGIDYWNGSSWMNTTSGALVNADWKTFNFSTISGSKIRIRHISGNSTGGLDHLSEFEPYYNEIELYDTPTSFISTHTSGSTQITDDNLNQWQTFTVNYTKPTNTNVQFRFRTSIDASTWTSWTAYQTPVSGSSLDISSLVTSESGGNKYKYFQVETKLTSTDGVSTPSVADYTIAYSTVDSPPTISISSPSTTTCNSQTKAFTNQSSIIVSGTASDTAPGTVSSVTVNSQAATGTTSWSKTGVALSEGDNTITAVATDDSSQTASATRTVHRDSSNPSATITTPSGNVSTTDTTYAISGTSTDGSGSGVSAVSSSTGSSVSGTTSWSTTVNLSVGANTITITSTDCAGNTGTGGVVITRTEEDPEPPTDTCTSLTVISPNGGESYLVGAGTGAVSSTNITWNKDSCNTGNVNISYSIDNSNYTSIATNETNDGTYTWSLPSIKSSSVKVKVQHATNTSIQDTSDNNFTIHSNSAPGIGV